MSDGNSSSGFSLVTFFLQKYRNFHQLKVAASPLIWGIQFIYLYFFFRGGGSTNCQIYTTIELFFKFIGIAVSGFVIFVSVVPNTAAATRLLSFKCICSWHFRWEFLENIGFSLVTFFCRSTEIFINSGLRLLH